jgi:hypothetical protein
VTYRPNVVTCNTIHHHSLSESHHYGGGACTVCWCTHTVSPDSVSCGPYSDFAAPHTGHVQEAGSFSKGVL